jgi:tetratricopeptide (TPR) repeat protein
VWQAFYDEHRGPTFELLSIAVDVQGPDVVRPYTEQHGVTFPVAVDTSDVFGRAFGLKAIPVSVLVDEVGIIRLQGEGPKPEFLRQVEAVLREPLAEVRGSSPQLAEARSTAELGQTIDALPSDWRSRLALAQSLAEEDRSTESLAQCEAANRLNPDSAAVHFTWGQILLRHGAAADALPHLKRARDLDPDNWRIRKQIWAIEHPDKFYTDRSPDYDWQAQELAREKAAPK